MKDPTYVWAFFEEKRILKSTTTDAERFAPQKTAAEFMEKSKIPMPQLASPELYLSTRSPIFICTTLPSGPRITSAPSAWRPSPRPKMS